VKKRGILISVKVMVGMLLVITALAGCTKSKQDTPPSNSSENQSAPQASSTEKVKITFLWEKLDDATKANWEKFILNPFKEKHPNIEVDFQPTPDHINVIKTQLASGGGPDLFIMEPADVVEYARADRLLSLDPYVEKYKWDKVIYDWALKATKIDGHQFGIPHSYEGLILVYNKSLLDANGWPIPTTVADFEQTAKAAKDKGIIPVSFGTQGASLFNMFPVSDYFDTFAGHDNIKKLLTGEKKFTDPEFKGAIELYNKHWQDGWYTEKNTASIDSDAAWKLFYDQKALFNVTGTWVANTYNSAPPKFEFGQVPWPSMKDGIPASFPVGIGAALGVNKKSEGAKADAVAELINFMYTEDKLIAEGIANGMQPLARSIDASLYPAEMNKDVKNLMSTMTTAVNDGKAGYTLWTFYPGKVTTYLYENIEKVNYGTLTIDEFLLNAQKVLDEELAGGWKFPG
jgi:ABC-type glycerol-3-phosphate transport system substrate-binding protein